MREQGAEVDGRQQAAAARARTEPARPATSLRLERFALDRDDRRVRRELQALGEGTVLIPSYASEDDRLTDRMRPLRSRERRDTPKQHMKERITEGRGARSVAGSRRRFARTGSEASGTLE